MKLYIAYADAQGWTDGVTEDQLFRHLPRTTSLADADAILLVAVCHAGFKFNHALNGLVGKKPIIVVNYLEYGWQYKHDQDNVLGHDYCVPCADFGNADWGTLNLFVSQCNPLFQFHRELRKVDMTENIIPIDFLAHLPKQKLATKAEYDARPFQVFNSWGYSHPNRSRVHGDIFRAMGERGINVIDGYDKLGGNAFAWPTHTWLSVFTPHWTRKPMSEVLKYQSQSKISISLYGAGWKCFRSVEAPENCIMAQQNNNLAWSYEWDESNSIRLNEPNEVANLLEAVERTDLYEIYLASQENIDRYRIHRYMPDYILKNIAERL